MSKADEIKRGTELLRTPKGVLTSIQQQEKFLFGQDSLTPPCPGCGVPLSKVEAAPETYRIGFSEGDDYSCPSCAALLRYILPFFGGGWHWQLAQPPYRAVSASEIEAHPTKSLSARDYVRPGSIKEQSPEAQRLIAGAAEAQDIYGDDELEEYARRERGNLPCVCDPRPNSSGKGVRCARCGGIRG